MISKSLFKRAYLTHLLQYNFSTPAKLHHLYIPATNPDAQINLLILHGILGSSQTFKNIAKSEKISKYANSYLVDLRNHGDSEHRESMLINEMAEDVNYFIKENKLDSKKIVVMGHSLGAKVAMDLVTKIPDTVHAAIVIDYAPYNYHEDERFQVVKNIKSLIQQLDQIDLSQPIEAVKENLIGKAKTKELANLLLGNLIQTEGGKLKWKSNMRVLARQYEQLNGIHNKEKKFSGHVQVIVGEKSEYITDDILHHYKKVFEGFNPNDHVKKIQGAGHWVHFHKPHDFIQTVSDFLAKVHDLYRP